MHLAHMLFMEINIELCKITNDNDIWIFVYEADSV